MEQVEDRVAEHRAEPTVKARQISQVAKAVMPDHNHIQDQVAEQAEPRHYSLTHQQLQQQVAAEQVVVQEQVQTAEQVSTRTQQHQNHQGHWARTVRITPATVVVAVPEAAARMAARVDQVDQETTAVVVVSRVQTLHHQEVQKTTDQV